MVVDYNDCDDLMDSVSGVFLRAFHCFKWCLEAGQCNIGVSGSGCSGCLQMVCGHLLTRVYIGGNLCSNSWWAFMTHQWQIHSRGSGCCRFLLLTLLPEAYPVHHIDRSLGVLWTFSRCHSAVFGNCRILEKTTCLPIQSSAPIWLQFGVNVQVLYQAAGVRSFAQYLVEHTGLISWLSSVAINDVEGVLGLQDEGGPGQLASVALQVDICHQSKLWKMIRFEIVAVEEASDVNSFLPLLFLFDWFCFLCADLHLWIWVNTMRIKGSHQNGTFSRTQILRLWIISFGCPVSKRIISFGCSVSKRLLDWQIIERILSWANLQRHFLLDCLEELSKAGHVFLQILAGNPTQQYQNLFQRSTLKILLTLVSLSHKRRKHQTRFTLNLGGLVEVLHLDGSAAVIPAIESPILRMEDRALALQLVLHVPPHPVYSYEVCLHFASLEDYSRHVFLFITP